MPRNFTAALARLWGATMSLAVMVGTAGAQTPKVYHACYVPTTGTVYRIKEPDTPSQCGASTKKGVETQHIEFSWTDGAGALRVSDPAGGDLSGPLGSPAVAKLLGRALGSSAPANGNVLTWDAAANQWQAKAPAGSGATDHGSLAGLSGDDHPQYALADGVRHATNGFAITGTRNTGTIPVSGQGARMMWYPGKAAFRAGEVTFNSGPWDDPSIGVWSIGMGINARASGEGAVALGVASFADGHRATALAGGFASGQQSFAVRGSATGTNSVAIGWATDASGERSMALGSFAGTSDKIGAFVWGDASSSAFVRPVANNQFVARAARFWLGNDNDVTASPGRFLETSTGAFLSSGGTWTNSSDATRKTGFAAVDGERVLEKLAAMPISTWSYRDEDASVRHMGPTAQDFRAAFVLGSTDTAIATVDADGVSLAAIKALVARTATLNEQNRVLREDNADMRATLRELRQQLSQVRDELARLLATSTTTRN